MHSLDTEFIRYEAILQKAWRDTFRSPGPRWFQGKSIQKRARDHSPIYPVCVCDCTIVHGLIFVFLSLLKITYHCTAQIITLLWVWGGIKMF